MTPIGSVYYKDTVWISFEPIKEVYFAENSQ